MPASGSDIPVELRDHELAATLQTLRGMGSVKVATGGDCAAFQHRVEWLTAGGDQPSLLVGADN